MVTVIHRAKSAARKSFSVLKNEGIKPFVKGSTRYLYYKKFPDRKKRHYKDILFINGCTLEHPERYRVHHQIEQLKAHGISADSVFYEQLDKEMLKYYRGFVFFRCPITDTVRSFIELAKNSNKKCFFDVDDLVIDQKYTDQIEYVKNMGLADKAHYDDGVIRMRETLKLCDFAITTTECLQEELKNYQKDVFINRNVASDEMVSCSKKALDSVERDDSKLIIGYFSGSITHNSDFELVLPSLLRLLKEHDNLYLKIAGILDLPKALEPFRERVLAVEFMDWREMPKEMAPCDIIIAPLTQSIFNEAKSENKWTEASLVKVPTVASDIGAFRAVIENDRTGVLVKDNEWYDALNKLIKDKERRERIAQAAYNTVIKGHTTFSAGRKLAEYIQSKLTRNIAFILPSTDISGGVNVVLKHAEILQENGWDVTLVDAIEKKHLNKSKKRYDYRSSIPGYNVVAKHRTKIEAYFDTMAATLWSTVYDLKKYTNAKNKLYFVQNYETGFYEPGAGEPRILANATYSDFTDIQYTTMSLWCKKWLKEQFGKDAKYCSNGIDLKLYKVRERDFSGKIKILVEGDSSSIYKNTDEAFRIISELDPNKFDISYLSYRKEPKDWYRVDHFYNRIPPEEVGEVYASCDILLKTSLLESFSYPPLEMMATGGISIVVPNDGNIEYLRDKENCLFYEQGNTQDAREKLQRILEDNDLRQRLIAGGLRTAKKYQWKNMEKDVLALYS